MKNILLLGDVCKDVYHYGICERLSPEAPVPILDYSHSAENYGMAYNVYKNLLAFRNNVDFFKGPLSTKVRYVDSRSMQQLLRIDYSPEEENIFLNIDYKKNYDAIVISDYNKGFVTEKIVSDVKNAWKDTPIFVDTKKQDLSIYEKCIVKINEFEYKNSFNHNFPKELIVTLGSKGARRNTTYYSAKNVEVHDVTGAGDVFLACLTSFFIESNDIDYAIENSITLASESVKYSGSYTITEKDIHEHTDYWA